MEVIEDAAGIRLRERIPRVLKVQNPAVGTDWTINVTAGTMWYVQSIAARLVTSAVVANRSTAIIASDGTDVFMRLSPVQVQVASVSSRYSWVKNQGYAASSTWAAGIVASFPSIPLFGGFAISASTPAIDVGDQWSEIVLYVIETEERPYDVELNYDLAQLRGKDSNAYPFVPMGD